jgi:hypothetical protein
MVVPTNTDLYNAVKIYADIVYKKPSAYKSGFIVKMYKKLGGKYKKDNTEHNLKRWFEGEKWININPLINKKGYPVYRPTVKVNSHTPKTVQEIPLNRLKEQYKLKQKIKGKKKLPKF